LLVIGLNVPDFGPIIVSNTSTATDGLTPTILTADAHDPIEISSDVEFDSMVIAEGWPGNGSPSDPYIIENLSISALETSINITDVNASFIIRNCELTAPYIEERAYRYSVLLDNSSNGAIESCVMANQHTGIYLRSSPCRIFNNTIYKQWIYGINVWMSSSSIIENNTLYFADIEISYSYGSIIRYNTVTHDSGIGIDIGEEWRTNVSFNTIINCSYGIYSFDGEDCVIVGNVITDCEEAGINLSLSRNMTVLDNEMQNCGLSVSGISIWEYNHTISGNTVNGLQVGYLTGLSHVTFDDTSYGQLILVQCDYVTIQNSSFHNVSTGVTLGYCTSSSVLNTEFYHNGYAGLWVSHSDDTIIDGVTARDNKFGIYLWESPSSTVRDCILEDNWDAGILNSGADFSTMENNVISSSSDTVDGINLSIAIDCVISQNTLTNVGIDIQSYQLSNWKHTFSGNAINGKPLGYFEGLTSTSLDGTLYGQLILLECENVIINGGNFSRAGGVSIYESENCTLHDAEIIGSCDSGVELYRSPGALIENVDCSEAFRTGIRIHQSSQSIIKNCDSNRSSSGGISVYYSENCVIQGCRVSGNYWSGIALDSSYSIVGQNWIRNNEHDGLVMMDCSECTITENVVIDNKGYGVVVVSYPELEGRNHIYGNSIGWNVEGNAIDYGLFNTWDNGVDAGNAWSDYNGTGYYYIEGEGGSVDRFPTILNRSHIDGPTEPQGGIDIVLVGVVGVSTSIVVGSLIVYWRRKYPFTEE
jgi:parallel beta-helix repeat protein